MPGMQRSRVFRTDACRKRCAGIERCCPALQSLCKNCLIVADHRARAPPSPTILPRSPQVQEPLTHYSSFVRWEKNWPLVPRV